MKKKTIIIGAVVTCLLLTSGVTVFAARDSRFPDMDRFGSGRDNLRVRIEARREVLKEKLAKIRDSRTDMSAYEQYGLTYDESKGGWTYEGKLVGVFVDKYGKGITVLSKDGEVHLKAVRDENGNLTGIDELTDEQYSVIMAEIEKIRDNLKARLDEKYESLESRKSERLEKLKSFLAGGYDSADLEAARDKLREKAKQRLEQFKIEREQRKSERVQRMNEIYDLLDM